MNSEFSKTRDGYRTNVSLEEALNATGFGKFNLFILFYCGFLMAGMIMETLGFSYIIPASQCDLSLDNSMKGWVAAIPFTGFVLTSHMWGYVADTFGRRRAILLSTSIGCMFSAMSSFAPEVYSFILLRFAAALFISGGSALGYAFLGELVPAKNRDKMISLANASVILAMAVVPGIAWVILPLNFNLPFFTEVGYRPWRTLILCYAMPFATCAVLLKWVPESPKFFYEQRRYEDALKVLKRIYRINNGSTGGEYPVLSLAKEEEEKAETRSAIAKLFHLSIDIFKPPFTGYALLVCFLHFINFGLANGFYIWMPDIINKLSQYDGDTTFCNVMSNITSVKENLECDDHLNKEAFFATIIISLAMTLCSICVAFIVRKVGKRNLTIGAFVIVSISTLLVHWVANKNASVVLVFSTQLTNYTVGLVNAVVVQIFPTKMRAMAVSVSMMVGRIGTIVFSKGIGTLLDNNCTLCFYITPALAACAVSCYIPSDQVSKPKISIKEERF